eukprot:SAG31_NODE_40622_length_280_cov_0.569061_1_plen_64_part_10
MQGGVSVDMMQDCSPVEESNRSQWSSQTSHDSRQRLQELIGCKDAGSKSSTTIAPRSAHVHGGD